MERFVLLLRGINVGGVKMSMAELATALRAAGFTAVHTVLATGNALVDSDLSVEEVAEKAQSTLESHFGVRVPTLVYSRTEFLEIAAEPFPIQPPTEDFHRYLSFTASPAAARELAAQLPVEEGDYHRIGSVLYWTVRKGSSITSPLAVALQRLAGRHLVTTRNLNTVQKVAKLL